ncbi:hypothetical protein Tco_1184112 [Tanacetum coccineum]
MLTKPQVFYDESHKTALGYQNPLYLTQAQRKQRALYCGHTIVKKHNALYVIDTEETLKWVGESNLIMHAKQNDPIAKEKKVNIAPIDYAALNKLSEHFAKHFVPQKQLSAEQVFWLPISKPVYENPPVQPEPVQKDIPQELPSISVVKYSFLKLRSQLNDFENIIKVSELSEITKDGKVIASKELVRNLPKLKFDQHFCDACKIRKQAHASHKAKNIVATTRCLELLHMDLFGLSVVQSYGGNRYTLVIVDDYSRKLMGGRFEWKNLLIEHDNIIADGLSKEVFYVASNSELNVSRFTEMQKAHNVVKARCLELEAELSNLRDNIRSNQFYSDASGSRLGRYSRNIGSHQLKVTVEECSRTNPWTLDLVFKTTIVLILGRLTNRPLVFGLRSVQNIDGGSLTALNFREKVYGTVRFGNDHFGAIMGYEDYVVGDSVISRVYYVEGLGHNLFSVGQFCDSDLEVAFRKHSCYVHDTDGVELLKVAHVQSSPGPAPKLLTPGPISSGLVPNPAPDLPYVPPTRKELEMLFQPMFDEYFNPPGNRQDPIPNVVQDPVITTGEQFAEVNPFAAADPEPFVNVFTPDPTSEASSSGEIMMPELNNPLQPLLNISEMDDSIL